MRITLFLACAVVVLAGLWLLLKPEPQRPLDTPGATHVYSLSLTGETVDGPEVISVYRGDTVRIEITSGSADSLHLHGYDIVTELSPGKTTVLELLANRTGRFELESHHSHRRITVLEVHPR